MIIDTDVIIWDLRGNKKASHILTANIPFSISVITYMELIQGMKNKEEMRAFLRQLKRWAVTTIHLNRDISVRAAYYVEEFFLSHTMELADALIASTVIETNDVLLTANDKHYKHIPNIQLLKFTP